MGFFKGLIVSLLSLLLFLSLAVFGLVFMLNQTVLRADFVTSEVEKLDLGALAKELVIPQLPPEIRSQEFAASALNKTLTDLKPWMKEEAGNFIHRVYDYLLGESQSLSYSLSLDEFKTALKDNTWEAISENPPPELQGIPPALAKQYFNQYYRQFAREIPSNIEFDTGSLEPEVTNKLEQAREIIGYVKIAFWGLLGLMLVLGLSIFLISRNLRATSRSLGITSLVYGIVEIASVILVRTFLIPQLPLGTTSPALSAWLAGFASDVLQPLLIFGIGVAAAGLALIIASFFFKPAEEAY